MTGTDFNLATSILFVGYLTMQLPSNLILTRLPPSLYLGAAMTIWGVLSASQAALRNFGDLIACRFLLGVAEVCTLYHYGTGVVLSRAVLIFAGKAPFFPGAVLLLSSWYRRTELTQRLAWFYSGCSLANAFGGLIGAAVLGNLDGAHGIHGWYVSK